jgi:peptidoglycan/xylan/chitin deacetylase (PgdA/CDA1 family)
MQTLTIGFHDVVDDLRRAQPIAPGHTILYTLDRAQLRLHLQAIQRSAGPDAVRRIDEAAYGDGRRAVALTFDDGAISSYTCIAPELELFGWPGHFLVTTNWIGEHGFLDRFQIRDLERRGHVIGTHSCTHPERMSHLGWAALVREWSESCARLSDIVGHSITIASVPGGYFRRPVAAAAAAAGIKLLFTSEPTTHEKSIDGCLVLGRYAIRRHTPAGFSSALVSGEVWPRAQEGATWLFKKAVRTVTGPFYTRIRNVFLSDVSNSQRPI